MTREPLINDQRQCAPQSAQLNPVNIQKSVQAMLPFRLSTIFPTQCVVCGKACYRHYSLCLPCELQLPQLGNCCFSCGMEYAATALVNGICSSCQLAPKPFYSCRSVFRYQPPINKLLAAFKFHSRFEVGFALSQSLAKQMKRHYESSYKPDYLLPVPLHKHRLRQRGFNQALEISRVISRQCDIPVAHNLVRKIRDTPAQTEMSSARARKVNLQRAFVLSDKPGIKNVNSIAIIDDVVTTTATVSVLSQTLRSHGIQRVEVWSLARAAH